MKISIIVPVYNVEEYIDRCLASLVNQSLEDVEIIIVNDGSPDNSQSIIDKYVKKNPKKIKSFIQENGGQGSARNFGLQQATGEYIAYVDSDDWIESNMLLEMYEKASSENLDIVICGSYNVKGNDKIVELDNIFFSDNQKNAFFGRMAVWNKIYRRSLLIDNQLKFRSKVWYEDVDFTLRAVANATKIGYINKPLYNYLIREGSTMNNSNIDRNLEIIQAFEQVLQSKELKKYREIVEFLAIDHIYISAMVRVLIAQANRKRKKIIVQKLYSYINDNFSNYKHNQYLYLLSRNRKLIYHLLNIKQYWLIQLLFKIKRR